MNFIKRESNRHCHAIDLGYSGVLNLIISVLISFGNVKEHSIPFTAINPVLTRAVIVDLVESASLISVNIVIVLLRAYMLLRFDINS